MYKYDYKLFIIGLGCLIFMLIGYVIYEEQSYLNDLKNGIKIAICEMQNTGPTVIDPSKIIGVDMDSHTIIFTNGSASSCEVKNK